MKYFTMGFAVLALVGAKNGPELIDSAKKDGAVLDEAKKAEDAKANLQARYKDAGNHLDGLIHGSVHREFPEGGVVSGVNDLVQVRSVNLDGDDAIETFQSSADVQALNNEVKLAMAQAESNE